MPVLVNGLSSLSKERNKPFKYSSGNEAMRIKPLDEKSMVESVECSAEIKQ